MDEALALRLRLFREGGQAAPEVIDFVAVELTALEDEGNTVTEATAGMLTSHLTMALGRLLRGEPIEEFSTDEQVAAELAGHPEAVARARAISARAEQTLGPTLPESEINFLGLHLAALAQKSSAAPGT
ncbi:PRD domain-containing protein [Streptomyces sp. MBT56]|uniref:PRD domain-containing protein n=1 Tax=unclassified Streptomyces TaxID=2593676 RepID=UPI00190CBF5A|nr:MULTISPECIES: PRD domain-containing protein [unclassified Streptomyces]MBK3555829.1 PRD domain-containing protein [Streptomyces sp. MBT56]MBK3601750.1 PRD domain-containing protein [Streptomyces sp. MBT54]MBK3614270.1 PRD domain-containing protein [Streptomyces sp. MBT98]MBK6044570.1 PRD domain-containing protein [Streptomyces sp. MBT55]